MVRYQGPGWVGIRSFLPPTLCPNAFVKDYCEYTDHRDEYSSGDELGVDEPPSPPLLPAAGHADKAQTPQRDEELAEEASRRLKHATLAPRLTPAAYKYLSRPLVNWIRLTTCVRAQDLCNSSPTPAGEKSSDTYDARQIPRLNWWRLPRAMREAARLGIKFFFDRLPRGRRLRNYPMREAHQGACAEFARLVAIGAVGGPFADASPAVSTVHPMGAVLKKAAGGKPAKTRLVIDATASELNEALSPVPFALPSVADGVALVQENTHLSKLDLADGFFHCTVHPDDRHHLGLRAPPGTIVSAEAASRWGAAWRHRIRQDGRGDASNLLFRGNVALFGIKSSPYHFCKLTEMLQWIIRSMGGRTLAFVDDLILASVAHRNAAGQRCDAVAARSCEAWVVALRTLFNFFGFNEAVHKYEEPSRECEWLGLSLSSVTGRVTIPENKAKSLLALLLDFENRFRENLDPGAHQQVTSGTPGPTPGATGGGSSATARPTRHELQSLIGKLSFVSAAVQGGRCYLRRMYDTLPSDEQAPVVLDDAFWLDLAFWPPAIRAGTGATMPQHFPRPAIATISDASAEAGGYTVVHRHGRERHTVAWGAGEHLHSSNWRELATIVRMLVKYAEAWSGRRVVHATDNQTSVAAINHGTIRSTRGADDLMPLVREARACVAKHDIDLQAWHMSGTSMVAEGTDGLSRPRRGAPPNFFLREDVTQFVCAFHGFNRAEVAHDVADIRDCPTRMAGRNIFIATPFHHTEEAFALMCAAKGEDPAFTGCSILAPDWPCPPWASKLRHFRRAITFPAGSKLFARYAGGRPSPSTTPMVLWHMPRSMSTPPSRRLKCISRKLVTFLSRSTARRCLGCRQECRGDHHVVCTECVGHDGPVVFHAACIRVDNTFFAADDRGEPPSLPEGSFLGISFVCPACHFVRLRHRRPTASSDDQYLLALVTAAIVDGERGRMADSTRLQYLRNWRRVAKFTDDVVGHEWLPTVKDPNPDPLWMSVLYEHLSRTRLDGHGERNAGLAPPSIESIRATIAFVCGARRLATPATDDLAKNVLKGIKRRSGHVSKQPAPITLNVFIEITTRLRGQANSAEGLTYISSAALVALVLEFFCFFRGDDTATLLWDEIEYVYCRRGCTQPVAGGCHCHIRFDQSRHKTNPHGLTTDAHSERSRVIIAMRPRCGIRIDRILMEHRLRQECSLPPGVHHGGFRVLEAMPTAPRRYNAAAKRTVVSTRAIVFIWKRHISAAKADGNVLLQHTDVDRFSRHSSKHGGNQAARGVTPHDRAAIMAHGWAARRDGASGRRPAGDMSDYYDSIQDACNSWVRRLDVTLGI